MSERFDPKRARRDTLDALLDRIDHEVNLDKVAKRKESWRPYRACPIKLSLTEPGGTTRVISGISRYLSSGGISIICNGYLHAGCTDLLANPVQRQELLECVLSNLTVTPLRSSLADDAEMEDMIHVFVDTLSSTLAATRNCHKNNDLNGLWAGARNLHAAVVLLLDEFSERRLPESGCGSMNK